MEALPRSLLNSLGYRYHHMEGMPVWPVGPQNS